MHQRNNNPEKWRKCENKSEWLSILWDDDFGEQVEEQEEENRETRSTERLYEEAEWMISIGPVEEYSFGSLKDAMMRADNQIDYCKYDIIIYNRVGNIVAYREWVDQDFSPGSSTRVPYSINDIIDFECLGYYKKWKIEEKTEMESEPDGSYL